MLALLLVSKSPSSWLQRAKGALTLAAFAEQKAALKFCLHQVSATKFVHCREAWGCGAVRDALTLHQAPPAAGVWGFIQKRVILCPSTSHFSDRWNKFSDDCNASSRARGAGLGKSTRCAIQLML